MKNITVQLFVTLGVIFLILVIFAVYFFVTDPYEIKPLLFGTSASIQSNDVRESNAQSVSDTNISTTQTEQEDSIPASSSGGFELSSAQVEALISLGIDPETVPSSISAQQEACFVETLGEDRVVEIKGGAIPSAIEFMKAKSCI